MASSVLKSVAEGINTAAGGTERGSRVTASCASCTALLWSGTVSASIMLSYVESQESHNTGCI